MARDIVVVGGSAGALPPLREILRAFPSDFPAAFFVVIHTSPTTPGMLPMLLESEIRLSASYARDGEAIRTGHVYVAPRDHHLLLDDGRVNVARGPRENGFRPAADPLFRTAAERYGPRVVGLVLSGSLDDGTAGLCLVKRHGGIAVVQDPDEATMSGMPRSAIDRGHVDHVARTAAIPALLTRLVTEPAAAGSASEAAPELDQGTDPAEAGLRGLALDAMPGPPSPFTCPECGGSLWETADDADMLFNCHVGHAYAPDALENGMGERLESALWTALRTLEEHAAFFRRMQGRARERRLAAIAAAYGTKATDVERRAEIVRAALLTDPSVPRDR